MESRLETGGFRCISSNLVLLRIIPGLQLLYYVRGTGKISHTMVE